MKRILLSILLALPAIQAYTQGCSNLVTNGDFESGNTGFTTAYTYNPTSIVQEGTYAVVSQFNTVHSGFFGNDHTNPPTGKAMMINGSGVANTTVWAQTITGITPNTTYYFSTWVNKQDGNPPPVLQFSINGVQIGTDFSPTTTPNVWQQFFASWNSGSNTSATIRLVDQQTALGGNDFAIDDIFFTSTSPLLMAGILPTDASCAGAADGKLGLAFIGGVKPYEFSIDGGATYSLGTINSGGFLFTGLNPGNYSVMVRDACGNVSNTYPATVGATDLVPPVISGCPSDITVYTGANATACSAIATWTAPTAADNCSSVTTSASHQPGTSFSKGATTVTYTFTDASSNTSTCSFTVNVVDNTAPVIACPASTVVNTDPGNCGAVVTYNEPAVSDNCSVCGLTSIPGYTYLGKYNGHSYFVSDNKAQWADFNTAAQSLGGHLATVTSAGEQAFLQSKTSKAAWIGLTDQAVEGTFQWVTGEPVSYVNWCTGEPNNGPNANEDFAIFNSCSGKWNDGNNNSCCPQYAILEFDCGAVMTSGIANGQPFPIGTTTITYQAKDNDGNTSTCSFTVTVEDHENPVITTINDKNVFTDAGVCGATVSWTPPTASDNCTTGCNVTSVPGYTYVGSFQGHRYFLSDNNDFWSNIDAYAKSLGGHLVAITSAEEDSFLRTVVMGQTLIGLNDQATEGTFVWSDGEPATYTNWCTGEPNNSVNAEDFVIMNWGANGCWNDVLNTNQRKGLIEFDCGIYQSAGPASGTVFPVGTTTVTYTASDASRNISTMSFDVIVTDNELPVITTNGNMNVANDAGVCGASVNVSASATDNCSVGVPTGTRSDALPLSAVYPVGTTTITWSVTDNHGNNATATQTVMVTDTEDPTITAPAPVTADADNGECYATITNLGLPDVADNCAVGGVINNAPLNNQYPVGTTTVTWTVSDIYGHTSTATQSVIVTDNQAPSITAPAAVTVNTDPGQCSATGVVLGSPTTADNCGVASVTNDAPAVFPKGNTTVTWTVTDIHGKANTATQIVTVVDDQAPSATAPAAIAECDMSTNATNTHTLTLTASDNCGVASVTYVVSGATTGSGAGLSVTKAFNVGMSTITWTVKDDANNTTVKSTTVTIWSLPTVSVSDMTTFCKQNTIYTGYGPTSLTFTAVPGGGAGGYTYRWTPPASNVYTGNPSYTVTGAGVYTVTVKDANGCVSAPVSKTVVVKDVRCGNKNDKVMVCHNTGSASNPNNALCISPSAVPTHLSSHGDCLGDCSNNFARGSAPSTSGIMNLEGGNIVVFPNPASGKINVALKEMGAAYQSYQITDINGRVIINQELSGDVHSDLITVDISRLTPGIYIIRAVTDEGTSLSKFTVK